LLFDVTAMAILIASIYFAWRRKLVGYIGTSVVLSLFSVLNIIPVAFDESYYHERYVTTAVASVCMFLPLVSFDAVRSVTLRRLFAVLPAIWLILAVANIRTNLPLWGDESKTWQWVLKNDPDSITAKDHLLSTYIELDRISEAQSLADALVAQHVECPNCLLNAANLALAAQDTKRATTALDRLRDSRLIAAMPRLIEGYVLATAELSELQGDFENAEQAFKAAIDLDPLDPQAQMGLALFLAHRGRFDEARQLGDHALKLFSPNERVERQKILEHALPQSVPAE
jgi:tetratricopeptide (TPR) repeat protein